jgi:hypothetical protein
MSAPDILATDLELLKLKRQNEQLLRALELFMPVTFDDERYMRNLVDDEIVKIRVNGGRLKTAIELWEKARG